MRPEASEAAEELYEALVPILGSDDEQGAAKEALTNSAPTPYFTGGGVGLASAEARVAAPSTSKAWSLIADESLVAKTSEVLAANTFGCRMRVSATGKSAIPVTPGQPVSLYATVRVPTTRKVGLALVYYKADGTLIGLSGLPANETEVPANTPTRVWGTLTPTAEAAFASIILCHQGVTVNEEVLWDGIFCAQGTRPGIEAAGAFFPTPAQIQAGWVTWLGTPLASVSTFRAYDTTWPGLKLCMALTAGNVDFLHEILTDSEVAAGWEILFDPERCPVVALPFLAQFPGAILRPDMTTAAKRAAIKSPQSFRSGSVPAIEEIVKRRLTGEKIVTITERYTASAWRIQVSTNAAETPEEAATIEDLKRYAKPIGIVLFFNGAVAWTWGEITVEVATYPTWNKIAEAFPTWNALISHVP